MTVLVVEVAALLALGWVGWVLAGAARGAAWRALAALPLGIAAYTLTTLVLLVARTSLAHPWVALGVTVAAAAVWTSVRAGDPVARAPGEGTGPWPIRSRHAAGLAVGVLLLVAVVTAWLPLVNLTADSFRFIDSSHALSTEGDLGDVSLHLLATRNLVVPALQGLAVTEFGYLRAVGPLLGLATLGLLWWLAQDGTRQLAGRLPWLLGAGAAALLATNSRFVFSTFYLNGHVLFACWVLLVVTMVRTMLLAPADRAGARDAWLVALLAGGLALLRAEGALLAALAVTPLVTDSSVPRRHRQVVLVGLGTVMATWQLGVLLPRTFVETGDLGPSVVGLGVLGLGLVAVAPVVDRVLSWLPRPLVTLHVGLWLATGVLAVRDVEVTLDSMKATFQNVTGAGLWGGSLLVLAALAVVAVATRRVAGEQALVFPLASFVPFGLLLALLRGAPYRVGPGDSLNRMLVHVVPVAVLLVALAAAGEARRTALRATDELAGPRS